MIEDRDYSVTLRHKDGTTGHITLTITGQQQQDTLKRRMSSMMPSSQVIDIVELKKDSEQLDLTGKPKK